VFPEFGFKMKIAVEPELIVWAELGVMVPLVVSVLYGVTV
jgi:hypothetical protein